MTLEVSSTNSSALWFSAWSLRSGPGQQDSVPMAPVLLDRPILGSGGVHELVVSDCQSIQSQDNNLLTVSSNEERWPASQSLEVVHS